MIKLIDLLKEGKGEKYPPYMYSPVGFGCHVCEYYYKEDGLHHCNNKEYQKYILKSTIVGMSETTKLFYPLYKIFTNFYNMISSRSLISQKD